MPDPLLEVVGVTMRFGGVIAVQDVSLYIARGEIFGLIGPNGAGKTTLFNVVAGQLRPTAGFLRFRGEPLAGVGPADAAVRGIGRTFQNVRLFRALTVLDNVKIGLHCRTRAGALAAVLRTPAARREERAITEQSLHYLSLVGLADQRDRIAHNLPYGDQRRLEIARALALEPELLLLDEPAAGMNPTETQELTALVARIRTDLKKTVFLIEHDMRVVMPISDRVAVLQHGQKIAEGRPAAIQTDPVVIEAYLGVRRHRRARR